ncbi:hypothetical protein GCM10007862_15550 [Dyella lipolytica]|uniref:DUF6438 domain-containing protein n=1 Tax=Dyella lipolytica TaxID=1867835 RepID=A0ABW8IV29_9GAMM|nr:DUF6438 domain-containing protein [Dyella lipolytica]GLQ46504.1 hypothetical protein GCM10007862_15550 [Dyella lipolytica]
MDSRACSRKKIFDQGFHKQFLTVAFAFISALSTDAHTAAPEPIAPNDTTISLTRSACYGECPNYTVVIHGDGRVRFSTEVEAVSGSDVVFRQFARSQGVLLPGTHEDSVPPQNVAELIAQFQRAGFWQLKDRYAARVTDSPTQIITLVVGGRHKQVIDYVGTEVGMPQSVRNLEDAIDRVAGTARWVEGNAALIPWLDRQGFDFRSVQASELAVAGERGSADEAMVLALLDRGASLNLPVDDSPVPRKVAGEPEPAGILLIQATFRRGHVRVFERLAVNGWLARWGKDKAEEAFAEQAAGCSPELVDAVAAAGINIDAVERSIPGTDWQDVQGRTALNVLGDTYTCGSNKDARVQTAQRLLAHGANPNHRDSEGHTPLYEVEDLDLLNLLLANGADATIKSNKGESVVFGSWTDAIVLRLLQAGASPAGHYEDGATLVQQAAIRKMPRVAKWLADHPEAYRR